LAFLTFKQISSNYRAITAAVSSQTPVNFLPERYSNYPTLLAGYLAQRSVLVSQYLGNTSAIAEFTIQPSGQTGAIHQKPLSRGTVTLNTTHPHAHPIVLHNAFSNPIDLSVLGEIVRWNRKHWTSSSSLARFEPIEAIPGAQYTTDKEILEALLDQGRVNPTLAHPSCSCPMMPEELGGCVSDTLEVYGVSGLSVADASIIPLIPAAHLQATMYAVGEKAADIIKARRKGT
jgi:choline dehydrogenase-like flavoprotein